MVNELDEDGIPLPDQFPPVFVLNPNATENSHMITGQGQVVEEVVCTGFTVPGRCPKCEGENLTLDQLEFGEVETYAEATCSDCGHKQTLSATEDPTFDDDGVGA